MVAQWAEKDWANGKRTRLDSPCSGHEISGLASGNEKSPATWSSRHSMPRGGVFCVNLTAANPVRDGICAIQISAKFDAFNVFIGILLCTNYCKSMHL